jgi:uncharacterized protein (TIGR00251 family)
MIHFSEKDKALLLTVYVNPGAGRDAIDGPWEGGMKVSVSAPPEKGKANKAVRKLIAKSLGIAPSRVEVVSGETARKKRVAITGVSKEAVLKLVR